MPSIIRRTWQHDVDSTRKGKDNLFIFYKDSKKITLALLKEDQPKASKMEEKSFLMIKNLQLKLEMKKGSGVNYIEVFLKCFLEDKWRGPDVGSFIYGRYHDLLYIEDV